MQADVLLSFDHQRAHEVDSDERPRRNSDQGPYEDLQGSSCPG